MHPPTLRRVIASVALTGLALLAVSSPARSQEDTAHLVLKKKMEAKERPSVYIVQKGDSFSTIIRRKLGKNAAQSAQVSRLVRKLNPQIRDVNLIYPGQKINLPRLAEPGQTQYIVSRGDTLSGILHARLGIARGEMAKWIGLVQTLNPGLANPSRIYPGQALLLPQKDPSVPASSEQAPAQEEEPAAAKIDARAFRLSDRELDIVSAVVKLSGGALIRSGKTFIPLTETEHLAVDCADVPMAELADGSRVFLDFGLRIPVETAALVRSRWGNFTVMHDSGGGGVIPVLERIFGASRDFAFRRHEGALDLGTAPALKLRLDWILVRRSADGRERILAGVCQTAARSQPIPAPISRYAEEKGIPVLEMDEGTGTVRDGRDPQGAANVPAIQAPDRRAFIGALLDTLGYAYRKDERIPIRDSTSESGPPALRTDYAVSIGARTTVIHFGDLPSAAQAKLTETGIGTIQIAEGDGRKTIVEKILKGLDIPYGSENEEFRPPADGSPPRWILTLGLIKITAARGTLYLVPDHADRELCSFIRKRWHREIVLY